MLVPTCGAQDLHAGAARSPHLRRNTSDRCNRRLFFALVNWLGVCGCMTVALTVALRLVQRSGLAASERRSQAKQTVLRCLFAGSPGSVPATSTANGPILILSNQHPWGAHRPSTGWAVRGPCSPLTESLAEET
jgi:hypothetical protein